MSLAARPKRGRSRSNWPGSADLAVTLSLAGRTAEPLPQAVPVRSGGFGGVDGLAALSSRRTDRCADRRDASLRRRHFRQRRTRRRDRPRAVARAEAPPWRKASRRRLDRGRHGRGCRTGARRSAKARVPGARPQGARALRGSAAAFLSRAQRRSRRPAARRAACELHHRARSLHRASGPRAA